MKALAFSWFAAACVVATSCTRYTGNGSSDSGDVTASDTPTTDASDASDASDANDASPADVEFGDAACSVVPQAGCGAGLACYVGADGTVSCGASGSGTEGAPCVQNTDCAPGVGCSTVNDVPLCLQYCNGDGDCASQGAGSYCAAIVGSAIGTCTPSCNPVTSIGQCPVGLACAIDIMGGTVYGTNCRNSGSGMQGTSCTSSAQCAAGYICATDLGCLRFCVVGGASTCSGGTSCHRLSTPARIGSVEYGACY